MLSKSSKAKRRKNAKFYKTVEGIEVNLIDNRNGLRFYLVTVPSYKFDPNYIGLIKHWSGHFELHGFANVVKLYRVVANNMRLSLA